jgi:hypothetical protein
MTIQARHNSVISRQLMHYAEVRDWDGMLNYLHGLTHSQFRSAGVSLEHEVLPCLTHDDFWTCFHAIVPAASKAFLMTFLKAAVRNYRDGRLNTEHPALRMFGTLVSSEERLVDEKKFLQTWLPVLHSVEEVKSLLDCFLVEEPQRVIAYLVPVATPPCYYVLFQLLRKLDNSPVLLSGVCMKLMREGSGIAFNLVSILKCYFDLPQVRGSFSLKLDAYELSRMDASYEAFRDILTRI